MVDNDKLDARLAELIKLAKNNPGKVFDSESGSRDGGATMDEAGERIAKQLDDTQRDMLSSLLKQNGRLVRRAWRHNKDSHKLFIAQFLDGKPITGHLISPGKREIEKHGDETLTALSVTVDPFWGLALEIQLDDLASEGFIEN